MAAVTRMQPCEVQLVDDSLGILLQFTPMERLNREKSKTLQRLREAANICMLIKREMKQFKTFLGKRKKHCSDDAEDLDCRLTLSNQKPLKKPKSSSSSEPHHPTPSACGGPLNNKASSGGGGSSSLSSAELQSGNSSITNNPSLVLLQEGETRKKIKIRFILGPRPEPCALPPSVPQQLREIIQRNRGSEVKLVIQKHLTATDVERKEARLSLPVRNLESQDFLTPAEKATLDGRDEQDHPNFINVPLFQIPANQVLELKLKKWEMRKKTSTSCSYVLCNKWNDVVKKNGLKANQFIQIWSFRADSKLCLAILRL